MTEAHFKAQFRLAKLNKKVLDQSLKLKPAAVLIPVVVRNKQLHIILTQRAFHLRHHPGQVSFPGGRYEDTDLNLATTALRETEEEIGISADKVKIFANMGLYRTVSNYKVTPYIGFVDNDYQLNIDKNEVQEVFEVPWNFLSQRSSHQTMTVERRNKEHTVHFMPYQDKMIWGTTALILHDLICHLE